MASDEQELSKKAAKRADKQANKDAAKAQRQAELLAQQQAAGELMEFVASNPAQDFFGYVPLKFQKSSQRTESVWKNVGAVDGSTVGAKFWIRGRLQDSRCKGSLGFMVIRERMSTVQVVIHAGQAVSKGMVKWASGIPLESIVDVYGEVVVPEVPVVGATQKVEINVEKLFCVNKASPILPFQLKDANRPEIDEEAEAREGFIRVHQDVRLDNRVLDLRTSANQAIFRIQSMVCQLFREFLYSRDFIEIHSPKLIGGASEGGSNVFKLSYFGREACLAQSPQLHKQMALCGDLDRVFEIGPVFRAENSNTHRHLCEFTGLDMEMTIKEHYFEILDVLDELFCFIFRGLESRCEKEISVVHDQYPASQFKVPLTAPRITYHEGVQMLRGAGDDIPIDISTYDINTEQEKQLGKLIKDKYATDFFMMIRYPTKIRPFYTMPCADDSTLSNSYDFFMRGEEIVSGAQRVHDVDLLTSRAVECGVPLDSIKAYVDSFRLGTCPHGGCGVGLERVTMLFLGLNNIRKCTLFTRDPKRLAP